ncbi:MAG: signal peptidase I [Candidatus Xenobiia bacterium LiM19]
MSENTAGRNRKWIAAAMALMMPGMGQMYNGELVKGLSVFVIFLVLWIIGMRLSAMLPDRLLIAGITMTVLVVLLTYIIAAIDAFRQASRGTGAGAGKSYAHWYFYVAVWLLCSILITGEILHYTCNNVISVYKIAGKSMEPQVLKGDRVIVDKTAYSRISPQKGDIIVFVYPDDRSRVYIKRVEALPGETITLDDGQSCNVPHGSVFLCGDNRESSQDSRDFGPVPLRDVIGKARQVFFSSDSGRISWERTGKTIEPAPSKNSTGFKP